MSQQPCPSTTEQVGSVVEQSSCLCTLSWRYLAETKHVKSHPEEKILTLGFALGLPRMFLCLGGCARYVAVRTRVRCVLSSTQRHAIRDTNTRRRKKTDARKIFVEIVCRLVTELLQDHERLEARLHPHATDNSARRARRLHSSEHKLAARSLCSTGHPSDDLPGILQKQATARKRVRLGWLSRQNKPRPEWRKRGRWFERRITVRCPAHRVAAAVCLAPHGCLPPAVVGICMGVLRLATSACVCVVRRGSFHLCVDRRQLENCPMSHSLRIPPAPEGAQGHPPAWTMRNRSVRETVIPYHRGRSQGSRPHRC